MLQDNSFLVASDLGEDADMLASPIFSMHMKQDESKSSNGDCMQQQKIFFAFLGAAGGFEYGLLFKAFTSYKYLGPNAPDVSLVLCTLIGGSIGWWIGGIVSEESYAKCYK